MVKYFYKRLGSVWLEGRASVMALKFLIIASPLFNTYLVVSLYPSSYHQLLVATYGCKSEKLQEAKWRSAEEQRPVHEMERAMDMDLFLGAQDTMGQGQPPSSYHPPWDVPTCHLWRMKGGGMSHPLRLPVAYAPAEPRGGTHHPAGPAGDQQGGTPRYLLSSLQAA